MKYKCTKHKTNNGYIDPSGEWHCWKCTRENQYFYPNGKVIEHFRIPGKNIEVRIVASEEHKVTLEVWDIANYKKLYDQDFAYLSMALRSYEREIDQIINSREEESPREEYYEASTNRNLITSSTVTSFPITSNYTSSSSSREPPLQIRRRMERLKRNLTGDYRILKDKYLVQHNRNFIYVRCTFLEGTPSEGSLYYDCPNIEDSPSPYSTFKDDLIEVLDFLNVNDLSVRFLLDTIGQILRRSTVSRARTLLAKIRIHNFFRDSMFEREDWTLYYDDTFVRNQYRGLHVDCSFFSVERERESRFYRCDMMSGIEITDNLEAYEDFLEDIGIVMNGRTSIQIRDLLEEIRSDINESEEGRTD